MSGLEMSKTSWCLFAKTLLLISMAGSVPVSLHINNPPPFAVPIFRVYCEYGSIRQGIMSANGKAYFFEFG